MLQKLLGDIEEEAPTPFPLGADKITLTLNISKIDDF